MVKTSWLTEQEVAARYRISLEDVARLIGAGELCAITFPGAAGRRIDARSVELLERVLKQGYVPPLNTPPSAEVSVGRWGLPSGREVEVFIGPAVQGVRRLRVFFEDTTPLSDTDARALQDNILPKAAARIPRFTGRGGVALFPVPPTTPREGGP